MTCGRVLLVGMACLLLAGRADTATDVLEFIWGAGGNPLLLNDQGSVQAFTFLQQLAPALAPETRRANWNTTNSFRGTESVYLARNWPFGVHFLVQQAGKTQIKAYAGWRGPVQQAQVLGGEVLGIPKGALHRDLAHTLMHYLMSKPVQESLVSALGWPSFRSDAYGTIEPWQTPYFAAVQEALGHDRPRPYVPKWSEVDRVLNGAFREIVYEGKPVQAVLDRYHLQLQEVQKRSR